MVATIDKRGRESFAEVRCNTCSARNPAFRYTVNGFHLATCRNCGLIAVANPPTAEELPGWYDDRFFGGSGDPRLYTDYLGRRGQREIEFRRWLQDLSKFQPTPGKLLEIGSAYGLFLNVARQSGWQVLGVELSPVASDYARSQLGLSVFTGDISKLPASELFDAAVGLDVIEHVADPLGTLQHLNTHLRIGGIVLLVTGNMASVGARLYGRSWHLMSPPWHLYFFTARTLALTMERAGMKVVATRYYGNPFHNRSLTLLDRFLAKCLANRINNTLVTKIACSLGHGLTFALYAQKVREISQVDAN